MRCPYDFLALLHLGRALRRVDRYVLHVEVHWQRGEAHLEDLAAEEEGNIEPEVADHPHGIQSLDVEDLQ